MTQLDFSKRNLAIDMLRAVTMFIMIFVNNFWRVDDIPYWMLHAQRGVDFLGLSDFVFPCFLVAVGMSIPYALERRFSLGYSTESTLGHILSRSFILWTMGSFLSMSSMMAKDAMVDKVSFRILMVIGFILLWNSYPKAKSKIQEYLIVAAKVIGVAILTLLAVTFVGKNGEAFYFKSSILGQIGWVYLIGSVVYLFTRDNLKKLLLVFGGFTLFALLDSPMREGLGGVSILNLPATNFIDDMLKLVSFDNGVKPALVMAGALLSIYSVKYDSKPIEWRFTRGMATALAFALVGVISHNFWIAAKLGATPPWLFFSIAISVALYTLFRLMCEYKIEGWYRFIRPAGTATLTCYVVPYALNSFISLARVRFPEWSLTGFGSIIHCIVYAAVVVFIVHLFEKVKIRLKI